MRSILLATAGLLLDLPLYADWMPLGPFGGATSIVVSDPHNAGTVIVGTRNGLLFRSNSGGESWMPLAFPSQFHTTLNTVAIDPQAPGVYLAGLSSDSPAYSGMLRSSDGGTTWRQVPEFRNQQVWAIVFKRSGSRVVAAGTGSGIFASQDGGITWSRISPADDSRLRPIMSLTLDPRDSATLYAGTPHLAWKTSDGGASWHSVHAGMIDDSDIFSIQVDRNRPLRVFVSACSGIYRSLNGGSTWTKLVEAKEASYRSYAIVQDPQFEKVWFAGTANGMVRSVDAGTTWEKVSPFATRSIAFDPRRLGRIFIATEEAGILRSEDEGKTWQVVNNGFCNRRLAMLWTIAGTAYTAALDGAASGSVFRLATDLGKWDKIASRLDPGTSTEVTFKDDGWAAAVRATGAFLARDGNDRRLCPAPAGEIYGVVSTRGRSLLAATNAGLKSSDDLCGSWQSVRGELGTDTIQAICRHPSAYALFAAKYGVIYMSVDGGRSWSSMPPLPRSGTSVKQIVVIPGSPDRLLVLTHQQGVWELPLNTATVQPMVRR